MTTNKEKNGDKWFDNEDKKLIQEYQVEKLDIIEISKLHQRTHGAIRSRLKQLGLINNEITENSYAKDQTSEIYKKICKYREKRYRGVKKENNNINKKLDKIIELLEKQNNNKNEDKNYNIQYIEIKNKTYILDNNKVYNINNCITQGDLYGYYNCETNKVKKINLPFL
jgi:hypothetical protein